MYKKIIKELYKFLSVVIYRVKESYLYAFFVAIIFQELFDFMISIGEPLVALSYAEVFYSVCIIFVKGCFIYTLIEPIICKIKNKLNNIKNYLAK